MEQKKSMDPTEIRKDHHIPTQKEKTPKRGRIKTTDDFSETLERFLLKFLNAQE
jgi:hypothetical protein